MKTKKIIVTGANGQLGQEFQKVTNPDLEFTFLSRTQLDITDTEKVHDAIEQIKPDVIINCAAYTAVDRAEEEVGQAFKINDHGSNNLAITADRLSAKLIHISTDYVYHIEKDTPLVETDICNPQGIYGKSKRAGELSIASQLENHIILRVSWLYGTQQKNFVKTMLRLGADRDALNIVNDQIGAPTYTGDVVEAITKLIKEKDELQGIYNYCNTGTTNWCDFAQEIFKQADISCNVSGISTEAYGAPAPRPLWSVMSTDKISEALDITIPHWSDSLSTCLKALKQS
jgi:dTDP-4-dehydrorhamnose reductase